MSGVAEKARFYLERAVPQLREWEEKGIFSKDEIRTIVQKRNDYEHKVLSPGNKASDWSSYARWEQSLEALRTKRCQRLKIRHLESGRAGQGRVLSIYDRAVGRHQGSSELWREYLSYTAKIKAAKRWRRTMTSALRMMPTDPTLWITAGRRSAKNGDMAAARGFFMRGCRFCNTDARLWLEYAMCEMEWLEKVEKRNVKGGKGVLHPDKTNEDDEIRLIDSEEDEDEEHGHGLPEPSAAQAAAIDKQAASQLKSNPALDGAIPMAIFDISKKQGFFKADVAEQFFTMFASFRTVSVSERVSQHVLNFMDEKYPNEPSTCTCHIRRPVLGVNTSSAEFPRNLRTVLALLAEKLETTTDGVQLQRKTVQWLDEYLAVDVLDEGIRTVLEHTRNKLGAS